MEIYPMVGVGLYTTVGDSSIAYPLFPPRPLLKYGTAVHFTHLGNS